MLHYIFILPRINFLKLVLIMRYLMMLTVFQISRFRIPYKWIITYTFNNSIIGKNTKITIMFKKIFRSSIASPIEESVEIGLDICGYLDDLYDGTNELCITTFSFFFSKLIRNSYFRCSWIFHRFFTNTYRFYIWRKSFLIIHLPN